MNEATHRKHQHPLFWAMKQENTCYIIENLAKQGRLCLNTKEKNSKRTPLHIACLQGNIDVIRILLQFGANPNCRDKHGKTPVHYVAYYGYEDCLNELKNSNQLQLQLLDNQRLTPAMTALAKGYYSIAKQLPVGDKEFIWSVKNKNTIGVAISIENSTKKARDTSAIICARYGYIEYLNTMIVYGSKKSKPLTKAMKYNNILCAELCLSQKANPNKRNQNWKPIHWAAYHNNTVAIKMLYQSGAKIEICTVDYETPIQVASEYRNMKATETLLRLGAKT